MHVRPEACALSRPPPVAGLAGCVCLGVAARHLGVGVPAPAFLLPLLIVPALASLCPGGRRRAGGGEMRWIGLAVALGLAGWLHADGWHAGNARDCRHSIPDGAELVVDGVVDRAWGRALIVRPAEALGPSCRAPVRLRLPSGPEAGLPGPGDPVTAAGRWRRWTDAATDPERAGEVVVRRWSLGDAEDRSLVGRWRWGVARRVGRLYPEREGVVAALVLARKDGIDPAIRESFTRAGLAHLLAISGFHVGVVAGLVLAALRLLGIRRAPAAITGAGAVWGYVLFIGSPDAATRAAILITLVSLGVVRGRPVHRLGALSAALLGFVVVDPGALARAGFQLSFAGAAGLVLVAPAVERGLERVVLPGLPADLAAPFARWRSPRRALAAGIGATMATLPAVVWHFDRASLIGIPATLVATPLVASAIPGILGSLVLEPFVPQAARFIAGGTDLLLVMLVRAVGAAAAPEWVSAWIPRAALAAVLAGAGPLAWLLRPRTGRCRPWWRAATAGAAGVALLLLWPPVRSLAARGTVEIVVLDVGQGDAIAVRSPRDRWLLVDAGPYAAGGRRRAPPVVRELHRRWIRRLEAVVLTHPHLDHVGGAASVIRDFRPPTVVGPGLVGTTPAYAEALEEAAVRDAVDWRIVTRGDVLHLDGLELEVLYPESVPDVEDPNDASVVLLLRFGRFAAVLTGDAPASVEDALVERIGDVDVLKVGHHGSRTSSSEWFLAGVRPEVALLSLGTRNRYGHPHDEVLRRLDDRVDHVRRTDLDGTVRVVVRKDGDYRIVPATPDRPARPRGRVGGRPAPPADIDPEVRRPLYPTVEGPMTDARPHGAGSGAPLGTNAPPRRRIERVVQ